MSDQRITEEGKYNVRITDCLYKPAPRDDDDGAFCVTLRGETEDGLCAYGDLYWTHKEISGGRNAGLTVAENSASTLESIGVPDGYPGNVPSAIAAGLHAQFVMRWDEWEGKRTLKVAFINPVTSTVRAEDVDWQDVMARFNGAVAAVEGAAAGGGASIAQQLPASDTMGDIPF